MYAYVVSLISRVKSTAQSAVGNTLDFHDTFKVAFPIS